MIPVALNPETVTVAVAGRGERALRRFKALRRAASSVWLFTDQPDAALAAAAGSLLHVRLPVAADLEQVRLLWVVGLPDAEAAELAQAARRQHVLVNVEDRPALCDFHSVAEVRRGDLLLTVSTGGASPGLAARIRGRLAEQFGVEWSDRLTLLRDQRDAWRRDGADVAALTDALLQANGWLA